MTVQQTKRVSIRYRPHHFLCTLGFQGKGYSPSFVENFYRITKILSGRYGDEQVVEVVSSCDDICRACPKRRARQCIQESTIQSLDQAHADALDIRVGQKITWKDAKDRLKERVSIADFHRICSQCAWKKLGHCEKALRALQRE